MSLRVLIADPSGPMRRLLVGLLEAAGISRPNETSSGEEALALFKPGGFDLVVLESLLPGKSGVQIVREIRASDQEVPIIMLSTEAREEQIGEAREAGVSEYLLKPLDRPTRHKLLEVCREHRDACAADAPH